MIITEQWDKILENQFKMLYIKVLQARLMEDASTLCPKPSDIWNALRKCEYMATKVVILGQDPYHDGTANGLSFSSSKITPSLEVIFKELRREFGKERTNPDLSDWAQQGVLLLNAALSTVRGVPGAHKNIGWEKLTGYILALLARKKSPVVFMLWGKDAQTVGDRYIIPNLTAGSHLVLKSVHPMVDKYGDGTYSFNGCGHFRKANDFLGGHGRGRIKWL